MVLYASAQLLAVCGVDSEQEFHTHVAAALDPLVDGPWTASERYRFDVQKPKEDSVAWISGTIVEDVTDEMYDAFKPLVSQHPFFHEVIRQPGDQVVTMNAYAKRGIDFEHTGLYQEFYRKLGITDQMSVAIQLDSDSALLVTFSRDRPFTAAETGRVAAIQPYVSAAWKNWLSFNHRIPLGTLNPRQIQDALGLTPRRAQVLLEIILGRTNLEISQNLGLTEATVRKHVQLLFLDLNVRSRHAATAFALRELKGGYV